MPLPWISQLFRDLATYGGKFQYAWNAARVAVSGQQPVLVPQPQPPAMSAQNVRRLSASFQSALSSAFGSMVSGAGTPEAQSGGGGGGGGSDDAGASPGKALIPWAVSPVYPSLTPTVSPQPRPLRH